MLVPKRWKLEGKLKNRQLGRILGRRGCDVDEGENHPSRGPALSGWGKTEKILKKAQQDHQREKGHHSSSATRITPKKLEIE